MRHLLSAAATAAAVLLAACSDGGPSAPAADAIQAELTALSSGLTPPGESPAPYAAMDSTPTSLRLTAEQREAIRARLERFRTETATDRAALREIARRVVEAREAGKTRDEIQLIRAEGLPIRARIFAAEAALRADLLAILTAEQRAWLLEHSRPRCDPRLTPPLSDVQRAQMGQLTAAFAVAYQADLTAIATAVQAAALARQNGATAEQIRAILEPVRPAMERVAAASKTLQQSLLAVLTPEQRASSCLALIGDASAPPLLPPWLLPYQPASGWGIVGRG